MSTTFSEQELAFFKQGDTLSDTPSPVSDFDFSDLDEPEEERVNSWVERALGLLSTVTPSRSES